MATATLSAMRITYATSKPFEIIDSGLVKLCARCGIHYETQTRRPPVMKLCIDCKDVCTATERRAYMTGR